MKERTLLLTALLFLVSCTPIPATQTSSTDVNTLPPDTAVTNPPEQTMSPNEPVENPLSAQPGDSNLTRGNAFIDKADLVIRESYPPQISLNLSGDLPTPCHQLRADVSEPTSDKKINVDVYSLVNPDLMCTQVLKPFEKSLNLGTFPSGHYWVYVNDKLVGEFDS